MDLICSRCFGLHKVFGFDEQALLRPVAYPVYVAVGYNSRIVLDDELEGRTGRLKSNANVEVAFDACGEHLLRIEYHVRILALDVGTNRVVDRAHLVDGEQVTAALAVVQQTAYGVDVLVTHELLGLQTTNSFSFSKELRGAVENKTPRLECVCVCYRENDSDGHVVRAGRLHTSSQ